MNIKERWFQAVEDHDQVVLQELLDRGADIDAEYDVCPSTPITKIHLNATALIYAVGHEDYQLIQFLLDRGASFEIKDCHGFSALTHALICSRTWDGPWIVAHPDPEPLRILLAAGARFGFLDAVLVNDVDLVRTLIDQGEDINKGQGSYHGSILHMAARQGRREVVDLLLERGADPDAGDDIGGRPLFGATENNHLEIVVALLDHGADINATDWSSRSALAIAMNAGAGHREMVALLESRGATRTLCDAIWSGDHAYLLEQLRADPTADWHSPERIELLGNAVRMPDLECVRLLLDLGADIRARPVDDRPILAQAVNSRSKEIVQLLIDRGADIHAVDEYGNTALMSAIDQKSEEIIAILRRAGAER